MQLNIDSTDIGGSGGRTLHGPVTEIEQGTIRTVTVGIKVTGDTVLAAQDNWRAARAAISKENARVNLTMDTAAGNYLVDEFPGNGAVRTTRCALSKDESRTSTALAIYGVVVITIDQTPVQASGGVGPTDSQRPRFTGQVGDWRLVRTLNEGGIETRSMQVSFGTQFDEAAAGPLAFSAVANDGGFARFQFAALTGVTPAKLRMIYVSGTANYDGPHDVESVDVLNFRVKTRTAFSADEPGTALFGEQTSPADVYEAAKADVLATLGVGSTGGRDSTTGLVLAGQTRDEQREVLTVTLTAEWLQEDYDSAIRGLTLEHETDDVAEWSAEPDAGAAPLMVAATVSFFVDKGATPDANYNPRALWSAIRATVLTRLKNQTGATDAVTPVDEKIRSDANSGQCIVALTLRARNLSVLLLKRTRGSRADLNFASWAAGEYEYLQVDGVPVTKLVTVTCTRVGVGEVELTVEPPTEPGYTFVDITEEVGNNGKSTLRGMVGDSVVYAQSLTRVYRRFRLAPGAQIRVRTPSSDGGQGGATSPVTGGGGIAPVASPQPTPTPPAPVI